MGLKIRSPSPCHFIKHTKVAHTLAHSTGRCRFHKATAPAEFRLPRAPGTALCQYYIFQRTCTRAKSNIQVRTIFIAGKFCSVRKLRVLPPPPVLACSISCEQACGKALGELMWLNFEALGRLGNVMEGSAERPPITLAGSFDRLKVQR